MKPGKLAAITLLAALLGACKLEVDVPTSGNVTTSSGNISCTAGNVCDVDISDVYFNETFVAEPAAGFVFSGWKAQDRGVCGDSTAPCRLDTTGLAGNDNFTALLEDPTQEFYLAPVFQSTGFNSLFMGHSFFSPFAEGMPFHAAQNGIANHTQSLIFSGASSGAPEALWNNAAKRSEIQGILNSGDIELFVMTYHPDYPGATGYSNWIDYALAQNPNTRFAIALPWYTLPASTSAATYASDWHNFHSTTFHNGIDYLRSLYPGTDIFCIPYGQSAVELRNRLAAGELSDVDTLISSNGDAIFIDNSGHADDILEELGRLVWLNAIYGVDLTTYAYDPGYNADLKAIAHNIMSAHAPHYDAPYR